jgi:hypothetical protein
MYDYNPTILLVWAANIDIQYIGESSMVLNRNITTFVTKAEKNASEGIWNELNRRTTLPATIKSYALVSF